VSTSHRDSRTYPSRGGVAQTAVTVAAQLQLAQTRRAVAVERVGRKPRVEQRVVPQVEVHRGSSKPLRVAVEDETGSFQWN
jgi:hypothetical protein